MKKTRLKCGKSVKKQSLNCCYDSIIVLLFRVVKWIKK